MDVITLDRTIYVQISYLKKFGVKEQSIHNQLSRNRTNQTKFYEHFADPEDKRTVWIKYASISPDMMKKYKLPNEVELLKSFETNEYDKINQLIAHKFEYALKQGYKSFLNLYQGYFHETEIIHDYAKNHAVFVQVQQMRSVSLKLNLIFNYYKQLDLVFTTQSLKAFYRKIKDFEKSGHESLIHGSLGKLKHTKKLTEVHIKKIKELFKDKRQFSYRVIHEKLNSWAVVNGYSKVSVSTVKKVLSEKAIQNECKPTRNGGEWAKTHLEPFRLREQPTKNGEIWQMDGSRFQFPFLSDNGQVAFLFLFVIMDVSSRKIIGYSTGKTENHILVSNALKKAAETTGFLPSELLRDNGSCYKHANYKILEEYFTAFGTNIRKHLPGNPNDKGHIESFFSVFQSTVCKGEYGYMGEGIRSKREYGRPSRDVIQDVIKTKNLRTKSELEKLVDELINKYNNLSINPSRKSPELSFQINEHCSYSPKINENDIALMFWKRVQEYHVQKSMVLLSEGSFRNKQFQYIIEDETLRLKLNGTRLIVCYQKEDRDRIKLFDQNEKFITELKYSKPVKIVHRPKENKPSIPSLGNSMRPSDNFEQETSLIPKKHQLFKTDGTLEILLIKTKGDE